MSETEIREFGRDLSNLEGRYTVEMTSVKERLDKQDTKLDDILEAIHNLDLHRAETTGRDRILIWGGSGIIAVATAWVSKHIGLS